MGIEINAKVEHGDEMKLNDYENDLKSEYKLN